MWYHTFICKKGKRLMATGTLEERMNTVETKLEAMQEQLMHHNNGTQKKRGWRWFVGIDAENPHFEDAIRLGQEWRNADRPTDEGTE